jgi:hypothetical protein
MVYISSKVSSSLSPPNADLNPLLTPFVILFMFVNFPIQLLF